MECHICQQSMLFIVFHFAETEQTINVARKRGEFQKESSWAAVLGIHILQKLSVAQDITFDFGYSHKSKKCPCGSASCQADIRTGDNSLGWYM